MRIHRVCWALCALVPALAGCGGDDGTVVTEIDPITEPGTYTREFGVDQLRRTMLIYVPASADLNGSVPVLMVLHGNPPTDMQQLTLMNGVADEMGFVVVYPRSFGFGEWVYACRNCNDAGNQGIDDTKYFSAVLTQLRQDLPVDNDLIFISGFSQGSLMTAKLGCALGSQISGIGIVGGIPWDWHVEQCSTAVPTIWMIGTEDTQFPYAGEPGPVHSQLPAEEFRTQWAARNGCAAEPQANPIEDIVPGDFTTATQFVYQNCAASFEHWEFEGMNHHWPGSPATIALPKNDDVDASRELGRFFLENPR